MQPAELLFTPRHAREGSGRVLRRCLGWSVCECGDIVYVFGVEEGRGESSSGDGHSCFHKVVHLHRQSRSRTFRCMACNMFIVLPVANVFTST